MWVGPGKSDNRGNELKYRTSRLVFLPALLFLCSFVKPFQDKEFMDYKIGPRDLLEISVFGLNDLNKTVRVSEDGKISLPLLGEVPVEGLTKGECEKKISQLLEEKWLQNPQVTIFIREYQSKRISLLGAVRNSGPYELLGRRSLLEIISQAGGLTSEAGNEILVMRRLPDGLTQTIRISIQDLVLKGDPALNIILEPSDIVNIPIDKIIRIYVFGQVRTPGALEVKMSNIPTVVRAIAQAGGFSDRAAQGSVIIKRVDEKGKEKEIRVNCKDILKGKKKDIPLQENDVVFVPETLF
jgi:polysaccharide export outer membrane protein